MILYTVETGIGKHRCRVSERYRTRCDQVNKQEILGLAVTDIDAIEEFRKSLRCLRSVHVYPPDYRLKLQYELSRRAYHELSKSAKIAILLDFGVIDQSLAPDRLKQDLFLNFRGREAKPLLLHWCSFPLSH